MAKAKVLERLIRESRMSVRAFSEKCDIPESTVYTILKKGAGKADVNNVIAMCKTLEITVEELDEMSKGITFAPDCNDVIAVYTRSKKTSPKKKS